MRDFTTLPIDEQESIKSTLRAFDEVVVFFEDGRFTHGVYLKASYAPDHEYIGTYRADEIFTEDERIENYINEFHSYPPSYKGKRDYKLMHRMDEERTFSDDFSYITHWVGKLINGSFELTERVTEAI